MDSALRPTEEIYQAGDFCIDIGRHRVTRAGVEVPLPHLSFELLVALAKAHPRMVTTDELLESVWAPAVVSPETVGHRAKLLRRALKDDPRAPRYVVGVRGVGYRMDAPVSRLERDVSAVEVTPEPRPEVHLDPVAKAELGVSASTSVPASAPAPSERPSVAFVTVGIIALLGVSYFLYSKLHGQQVRQAAEQPAAGISSSAQSASGGASLAVLPFIDMSPLHDQQYFSDGLAEEILNQLGKVPALRVVGQTSSFAFRGRNDDVPKIATALNANHLLEGSVRKDGNRIRISVQLIDAADGAYIWAQTYDRTLDDVFGIQAEIALAVANQLKLRLDESSAVSGGTRNFAAFDEFLTARGLLNSSDLIQYAATIEHLQKAVALDPNYLDAWLWLIDSYTRALAVDGEHRATVRAAQQRAIARVAALAPDTFFATIAQSYGALSGGQLTDAQRLLETALAAPQGARERVRLRYGQFLAGVGRGRAALDQLIQTRAAEPLDAFVRMQLVGAFEASGQLNRADAEAEQLMQMPGGRTGIARGDSIVRAMGRGDRAAVKAALAGASDSISQQILAHFDDRQAVLRQMQTLLDDPRNSSNLFALAPAMQFAAFFGGPDLALRAAHQIVALHVSFETWASLIWNPVMKDVRRQPGFQSLLQEMGVLDYWRSSGDWGDFCKPIVGRDTIQCT